MPWPEESQALLENFESKVDQLLSELRDLSEKGAKDFRSTWAGGEVVVKRKNLTSEERTYIELIAKNIWQARSKRS